MNMTHKLVTGIRCSKIIALSEVHVRFLGTTLYTLLCLQSEFGPESEEAIVSNKGGYGNVHGIIVLKNEAYIYINTYFYPQFKILP